MTETITEKVRRLFPQCDVSEEEILWHGRPADRSKPQPRLEAPFVSGYRRQALAIDGEVTPEELAALAEWSKHE